MGSAVAIWERLAPESVQMLSLLGGVGGCAPAGGLLRALGFEKRQGAELLAELEAEQLVRTRPMLGEELVQMVAPAWELLGLPPKVTTRLTYKRIRTGDLCLQYYAEFGRQLSAEVATGIPKAQQYSEVKAKLVEMSRKIQRQKGARARLVEKFAKLAADPQASEKDQRTADNKRVAADKELRRLQNEKTEFKKASRQILDSFRAASRMEPLGVYRDPGITEMHTFVALDLGYLATSLPEVLRRCDAVAVAARLSQYQLLVWGVERTERAQVEAQLKDLVETLGLRRAPQVARVLPFARVAK